jgi:hypothetical protein
MALSWTRGAILTVVLLAVCSPPALVADTNPLGSDPLHDPSDTHAEAPARGSGREGSLTLGDAIFDW